MDNLMMFLWIIPYIILARLGTKDNLGFSILVIFGFMTWGFCLTQWLGGS